MQNLQHRKPNELRKVKKKTPTTTEMLDMLLSGGNGYARIHLCNLKIEGREGGKKTRKTCVSLVLYLPVLYLRVYLFQRKESQAECARHQLACRL